MAGVLAFLSACEAEEVREGSAPATDEAGASASEGSGTVAEGDGGESPRGPLTGVWRIVDHALASASAMGEAEAREWHGRPIRLVDWEAQAPGARCAAPAYGTETRSAEAFIADFQTWPASLTLPVSAGGIEMLRVRCEGEDWIAPGGMLVRMPEDRALTVWDGVFFLLERDSAANAVDFRAQGNEPGWMLEIDLEAHIHLVYDYGERQARTPVPEPRSDSATGGVVYHAITEGSDLRVHIVPESCADDMSGFPFPATVTVTLGERTLRGCGGPVPFPPESVGE